MILNLILLALVFGIGVIIVLNAKRYTEEKLRVPGRWAFVRVLFGVLISLSAAIGIALTLAPASPLASELFQGLKIVGPLVFIVFLAGFGSYLLFCAERFLSYYTFQDRPAFGGTAFLRLLGLGAIVLAVAMLSNLIAKS